MKDSYTVYKHTCPNGKVYIGITMQEPKARWSYGYGYKTQQLFFRAIQKYGWNNIKHEILYEGLTKEQAEKKEIELIAEHKSNHSEYGYNIDNGGNTIGSFSEEHKKRISESQRKPELIEKRKAMRGENNPFFGKKHSEETRKKMSEAKKGRPSPRKGAIMSVEARKKMSEARKGKPSTFKGKHFSEESKKRLSEAHKGKMTGADHPRARRVLCVETNTIYQTIAQAARETGILNTAICACLKGKSKSSGGYQWEYVSEVIENAS